MFEALRRAGVFGIRHGFNLLAAFLLLTFGLAQLVTYLRPSPAVAEGNATVDKWKKVALSDVGLPERLLALEALRKVEDSAATKALEEVAKKGSLPVASGACAALGRAKTSASKDRLKALLENENLDEKVRMAAASCIAEHWKDRGDISYLRSKCEKSKALDAHRAVVESKVFGQ